MNIGQVMQDREALIQKRVDAAVELVHRAIFNDEFDLTPLESQVAWVEVITKLLESVAIDKRGQVTVEWLGLTK